MSEMYPEDPDIKFSANAIFVIKKTNPRRLQTMFHRYIRRYENEITAKNEEFFFHNDFVKDHQTNLELYNKTDYAHDILCTLRKYWSTMDEESKENIWKYLFVLCTLDKQMDLDDA